MRRKHALPSYCGVITKHYLEAESAKVGATSCDELLQYFRQLTHNYNSYIEDDVKVTGDTAKADGDNIYVYMVRINGLWFVDKVAWPFGDIG